MKVNRLKCLARPAFYALLWALTGLSILSFHICSALFFSAVSLFWLLETALCFNDVSDIFFDTRKQRRLWFGIVCGLLMLLASIENARDILLIAPSIGLCIYWLRMIDMAVVLRRKYRKVERGVVPANTWIDPPADAFQIGDVIGTTGIWWEPFQQAFAHCELISGEVPESMLQNSSFTPSEWEVYKRLSPGVRLTASSCSMGSGTYLHACEDVIRDCRKHTWLKEGHERWFCARLTEAGMRDLLDASGADWRKKLDEIVLAKVRRNRIAAIRENARRRVLIKRLPFLNSQQKAELTKRFRATGYNWGKMIFSDYEPLVVRFRMRFPRMGTLLFGNTQPDESDLCSTHVMSVLAQLFQQDFKSFARHRRNWLPFGFSNPVLPLEVLLLKSESGERYFRLLDERDRVAYEREKLARMRLSECRLRRKKVNAL